MFRCTKGIHVGDKTYYAGDVYKDFPKEFSVYFVEVKEEKKKKTGEKKPDVRVR